jgi:hypothetical protein
VLATVSKVNYKLVFNDLENYTVRLDRYLNMNNRDFCQQPLNKQKGLTGCCSIPKIDIQIKRAADKRLYFALPCDLSSVVLTKEEAASETCGASCEAGGEEG